MLETVFTVYVIVSALIGGLSAYAANCDTPEEMTFGLPLWFRITLSFMVGFCCWPFALLWYAGVCLIGFMLEGRRRG